MTLHGVRITLAAACSLLAIAVPAQDVCSTAVVVPSPLPQTILLDTAANADHLLTSCIGFGSLGGNDVWVRLPALTAGAQYRIRTREGSVIDTSMDLYRTTTTCSALTLVSCSDDSNSSVLTSEINFTAVASNTYYVHIESYDPGGGTFSLSVGLKPPTLTNDTCLNATAIGTLPYYNEIDATTANNDGDFDNNPSNGVSGKDAFWSYIPSVNGTYTARGENTDVGATMCLGYWGGACGSLVPLATPIIGVAPSVTRTLVAGTKYYLVWDDAFSGTAPQYVEINLNGGPMPPANDACAASAVLSLGIARAVDLSQSLDEGRDASIMTQLGESGLRDAYFRYTPATTGVYRFRASEPGGEPVLAVLTGTCGSLVEVDSAFIGGYNEPEASELILRLTAGVQYRVLTESLSPTIQITTVVNGPLAAVPGDTCSTAVSQLGPGSKLVNVTNMVNDTISSAALAASSGIDFGGRDAYFRFTPTLSGLHTFSVTGHADLNIAAWSGTCGSLTAITSVDDFAPPTVFTPASYTETESLVDLTLVQGTPIFITVDGRTWDDNSEFGDWQVVFQGPAPPPNETCVDSTELEVGEFSDIDLNENADEGVDAGLRTSLGMTGLRDAYHTFRPDQGGIYRFTANEPGGEPDIAVFSGNCGSLVELGSVIEGSYNDTERAELLLFLEAEEEYIVLTESAAPTTSIETVITGPIDSQPGDTCLDAITQLGPGSITVNVTDMTNDIFGNEPPVTGGPDFDFGGHDAFIRYTPTRTGPHVFDVSGRADLNISVWQGGSCIGLARTHVADDFHPAPGFDPDVYVETESLENVQLILGTPVYVVVDGTSWDDDSELDDWTILLKGPPPPANDTCTVPQALVLNDSATTNLSLANDEGRESSIRTALGLTGLPDVYYTFAPVDGGVYSFTVGETGGRPDVAILTGTCGTFTEIETVIEGDFNDLTTAQCNARLVGGTTYFVLSESANAGPVMKTIVAGPLDQLDGGDTCATAFVQNGPGMRTVDINVMTNDIINSVTLDRRGAPVDFGGRDAFYLFTPAHVGAHRFTVSGPADVNISAWSNTCGGTLVEIAAEDSVEIPLVFNPGTYMEEESLEMTLSTTAPFFIVVDGLSWDHNSERGAWTVLFEDLSGVSDWESME